MGSASNYRGLLDNRARQKRQSGRRDGFVASPFKCRGCRAGVLPGSASCTISHIVVGTGAWGLRVWQLQFKLHQWGLEC